MSLLSPQTHLLLLIGQDMTNGHSLTKCTMEKTIKDNIRDIENAREFLNAHYLSLLRKTIDDGVGGVHEHIMKMVNWFKKLKSMKVKLGEDFLIWQVFESLLHQFDVLRTSYNA
ncbi:hypothetical protein CR513_38853, partial [Mucuna pruriens]